VVIKHRNGKPYMCAAPYVAAKPGQTAYNLAFMDARYAPTITALSVQGYAGRISDKIFIQATDDFKVVTVKVSIYNAAGNLIEEGDAVSDGVLWMYVTTRENNTIAGSKIVATAFDLPGNEGKREVVF